jgi:RNA polymerase sigma factor (sigma-70 family)
MQSAGDIELLREYARRNSDEAFARLVARHVNMVYSAAFRKTGNAHAAEEVTQAVFIILAKKAASLRDSTILSAWLHQTTRFVSANFIRGEMRRIHREQEAYMQSSVNENESEVWSKIAPLLEDAMGRLSEKDRNVIALRFFEGKNFQEVGASLGVTENAAKKRLAAGLEKLRRFFVKRGVVAAAAVIAGAVSTNSVQAAPAVLIKTATALAVAKGAAATGSTLTLIEGALKLMAWTKAKTIAVSTAAILVAAPAAVVTVNQFLPLKEPSHEGRPLREWLAENVFVYGQPQDKRTNAVEAIRRMGRKTIPFLLADLGKTNSRARYKQDTRTPDQRLMQACWGFDTLGALAKSVIPELEKLLDESPGFAPPALAGIGPDAVPALVKALTNDNFFVRDNTAAAIANAVHRGKIPPSALKQVVPIAAENLSYTHTNLLFEGNTRLRAASLLGALKLDPDISVPALSRSLEGSHPNASIESAWALEQFGPEARMGATGLLKAIASTNDWLVSASARALSVIDSNALRGIDITLFAQLLTNDNQAVQLNVIISLGRMGSNGSPAVPLLISILDANGNPALRMLSAESLGMIGQSPNEVIPVLVRNSKVNEMAVQSACINALGNYGPAAQGAVPALIELARTTPNLKGNVKTALQKIDKNAAASFR